MDIAHSIGFHILFCRHFFFISLQYYVHQMLNTCWQGDAQEKFIVLFVSSVDSFATPGEQCFEDSAQWPQNGAEWFQMILKPYKINLKTASTWCQMSK